MIPTLAEIRASALGAFRLFLFDPRAYEQFNFSREGFLRSFFAAVLLAPVYFAILVVQYRLAKEIGPPPGGGELPSLAELIVVEAIVYPIYWLAFPAFMLSLTRVLGCRGRFMPYITVYNWSGLIAVTLEAIPFALYAAGVLPLRVVPPVFFACVVIALVYRWSFTRTVLAVPIVTAMGVVFTDVLLTMFIAFVTQAVI